MYVKGLKNRFIKRVIKVGDLFNPEGPEKDIKNSLTYLITVQIYIRDKKYISLK